MRTFDKFSARDIYLLDDEDTVQPVCEVEDDNKWLPCIEITSKEGEQLYIYGDVEIMQTLALAIEVAIKQLKG